MTSNVKRSFKTRTSRQFCQEKLCCRFEETEAELVCEDCGTFQCKDCERTIHTQNKYEFHDRRQIQPPPSEDLCQHSPVQSKIKCIDLNFADFRCEVCQLNFCFSCFDLYHKGPRRTHRKLTFKEYKNRIQKAFDCPILPLSPIGNDDDSLTFVTLPQIQDECNAQNILVKNSESMNSFSSAKSDHSQQSSIPDLLSSMENHSIDVEAELADSQIDDEFSNSQSFMLINDQEILKISDEDDFIDKLNCGKDDEVKVVSIFGNTGDGKSYTLNYTFFCGKEVFQTSAQQISCTVGVWAAYDPKTHTIVIDTEGLLGISSNQNQRTRLLLKVLAVSDVVIYRTRAERLHTDMFQFLCDASAAYTKHFAAELTSIAKRSKKTIKDLMPTVIIFHETTNTNILGHPEDEKLAESKISERFNQLDCTMDFKNLKYVGTKTEKSPTDFSKFRKVLLDQLDNKTNRAKRKPCIVYQTLKSLNDKFNGEVDKPVFGTLPDQLFTCSIKCLSCSESCTRSMNHDVETEPHENSSHCKYQHQYGNKVYLCKKCYMEKGQENIVVPKTSETSDNSWMGLAKYVWSGEVLECNSCGVIYRSREKWYGNKEIEEVVRTDIRHVWQDGYHSLDASHNAARKVIDGFHYIADSISSVGAKPTQMISDWMTDRIAPDYWIPNSEISQCGICNIPLENEQKHHCRACGKGFCDSCSSKKRPVPERGWGDQLVRVCNDCHGPTSSTDSTDSLGSNSNVTARKVGEVVTSALTVAASAFDYPIGYVKNSARPAYWIPDENIKSCLVCNNKFGIKLKIHHCRACGHGVCENCSPSKRPVPMRGWDYPVRVCNKCINKNDRL